MNVYCIYLPNGKRYVGIETRRGERIRNHRCGTSLRHKTRAPQVVDIAIRKHDWGNCQWRYLATNCTKPDAIALEKFFIRHHDLQNRDVGYNRTAGGDACGANATSFQPGVTSHNAGKLRLTGPDGHKHFYTAAEADALGINRPPKVKGPGRTCRHLNTPEAIAKRIATRRANGGFQPSPESRAKMSTAKLNHYAQLKAA